MKTFLYLQVLQFNAWFTIYPVFKLVAFQPTFQINYFNGDKSCPKFVSLAPVYFSYPGDILNIASLWATGYRELNINSDWSWREYMAKKSVNIKGITGNPPSFFSERTIITRINSFWQRFLFSYNPGSYSRQLGFGNNQDECSMIPKNVNKT